MMARRAVLNLALPLLALGPAFASGLSAQTAYPDRPIRLVVPFAPGGVNDAAARPLSERLKAKLGTIVIENAGGGGGSVGATMVARARPDGYTLLLGGAATHVVNPLAATRDIYDPIKDFEPILVTALTALGVVVNPAVPAKSLRELIDYVKANTGTLSYASPGVGSPGHLGFELFKSLIGAPQVSHVPYRGAGPALNDVVAGHVPLLMPSMTGQVIELHNGGKIRLLAVTSPGRMAALPDMPTAIEAGVPGFTSQSFIALFAPAGTPRDIIDKIAGATRDVLAEPSYQAMLLATGFEPVLDSSPEKAKVFVQREIERWRPIIKGIGLQAQ